MSAKVQEPNWRRGARRDIVGMEIDNCGFGVLEQQFHAHTQEQHMELREMTGVRVAKSLHPWKWQLNSSDMPVARSWKTLSLKSQNYPTPMKAITHVHSGIIVKQSC